MISTNKNPEPATRRQPSIPQKTSEVRQPRQKALLHKPLRRSRSIPRENLENIRRRARDFGEASDCNGQRSHASNQVNRHSFDALSVEHSRDFSSRQEPYDALTITTANVAAESRQLQVKLTISLIRHRVNNSCRKIGEVGFAIFRLYSFRCSAFVL